MNTYTIKLFDQGERPLRCETLAGADWQTAAAAAEKRLRNSRFRKASVFAGDELICSVGEGSLPLLPNLALTATSERRSPTAEQRGQTVICKRRPSSSMPLSIHAVPTAY